MRAADTSLVVAAFASWHEHHEVARNALDAGIELIEHCALETYSVLTRLPPPHRCPGDVVSHFLSRRFPRLFLRLDSKAYKKFVLELPGNGIFGGAAYDAPVLERHELVRVDVLQLVPTAHYIHVGMASVIPAADTRIRYVSSSPRVNRCVCHSTA